EAPEHLRQGNGLCRELWQKQGKAYDPPAHTRFIDSLIAVFTPEFFARVRGSGPEMERPIFIVGLPRSGTTLTEQILARSPPRWKKGRRTVALSNSCQGSFCDQAHEIL